MTLYSVIIMEHVKLQKMNRLAISLMMYKYKYCSEIEKEISAKMYTKFKVTGITYELHLLQLVMGIKHKMIAGCLLVSHHPCYFCWCFLRHAARKLSKENPALCVSLYTVNLEIFV